MAGQRLEANVDVGALGLVLDGPTKRLDFPRGEMKALRGVTDSVEYGAEELMLDKLHTRLDRTHWQADAGAAGKMYLRTKDGSLELHLGRVEMPNGLVLTRAAEGGVEILVPHAILHDALLGIPDVSRLRGQKAVEVASTALAHAIDVPLRQQKLRWLDNLTGEISVTVKVVLDLPVVGRRTLDQALKIPIKDGSLDYRALDSSLNWLEGQFVDLVIRDNRLVLTWRVPIVGSRREIMSWDLDDDARTLATFDRVPLRSLADFRFPQAAQERPDQTPVPQPGKKKGMVQSLTMSGLKVNLSMAAPHHVEIGDGAIQFGGDDDPGIVGLQLSGDLFHPAGPGGLTGSIALLDITAKDVGAGPATFTVDRLHLGDIETFEVTFDAFRPVGLTARVQRITASNLSLRLAASGHA
jgi:hypothetical protein